MARKPAPPKLTDDRSDRRKIIDAFLELLALHPFEEIGFAAIAQRSGLTLAQCRGEFGSTIGVLAGHLKDIDRAVLAGADIDMVDEPPRERLFDTLMRRLELLKPHKEAMRSLARSASRNPGLALALNRMAVRSQQWMLTASDIDAAGPRGMVRAQGLALLYARCFGCGSMTTTPDRRRRSPRSTASLLAGNDSPACSTSSAVFCPRGVVGRAGVAPGRDDEHEAMAAV